MIRNLFGIVLLLSAVGGVSAHGGTFSPLVVSGVAANVNEIADDAQPKGFELAKNIAPRQYTINENIVFSFDEELLPGFGEDKKYEWEIEETVSTGKTVRHRFVKQGSRRIYLRSKSKTESYATRIESLEVVVVPDKDYMLPKAVIEASGKQVSDTLLDYVETKPGKTVAFDATGSSGKIVSYVWDFGDGKTGEGKRVSHVYSKDTFFPVYAVLRVTDEAGVTADAAAMIDTPLPSPSPLAGILDAIREFFSNLFAKK